MKEGEYRVWNLLDPDDLRAASAHVRAQTEAAERDLALVEQSDRALARIQSLLLEMRELACQSAQRDGDRESLNEAFSALRGRIDEIARRHDAAFTPEEKARIQELLRYLHQKDG